AVPSSSPTAHAVPDAMSDPAAETPPVLALRAVRKTYPGVVALDGVDFEAHAASVHALVGENGAGKSTIVKLLAGGLQPDSGAIEIDGRPIVLRDALAARERGVAVVHQEQALAPDLSVAENVFLGRWPVAGRLRAVDRTRLHADAEQALHKLGARLDV